MKKNLWIIVLCGLSCAADVRGSAVESVENPSSPVAVASAPPNSNETNSDVQALLPEVPSNVPHPSLQGNELPATAASSSVPSALEVLKELNEFCSGVGKLSSGMIKTVEDFLNNTTVLKGVLSAVALYRSVKAEINSAPLIRDQLEAIQSSLTTLQSLSQSNDVAKDELIKRLSEAQTAAKKSLKNITQKEHKASVVDVLMAFHKTVLEHVQTLSTEEEAGHALLARASLVQRGMQDIEKQREQAFEQAGRVLGVTNTSYAPHPEFSEFQKAMSNTGVQCEQMNQLKAYLNSLVPLLCSDMICNMSPVTAKPAKKSSGYSPAKVAPVKSSFEELSDAHQNMVRNLLGIPDGPVADVNHVTVKSERTVDQMKPLLDEIFSDESVTFYSVLAQKALIEKMKNIVQVPS